MLLPVGAITQLASEGYATLQVAFLDLKLTGETKTVLKDSLVYDVLVAEEDTSASREEYPDEWFMWLKWKGSKRIPAKDGHLYLSEEGWENCKEDIEKAFKEALARGIDRGTSWEDFERMVDKHFFQLRTLGYSTVSDV